VRDIIGGPPGRAHDPIDELSTFRLGTKEFPSQSLCALLFALLFGKPVALLQLFDAGPDSFQFSESLKRHITIAPTDKPGALHTIFVNHYLNPQLIDALLNQPVRPAFAPAAAALGCASPPAPRSGEMQWK
jgi:hypothetical protein